MEGCFLLIFFLSSTGPQSFLNAEFGKGESRGATGLCLYCQPPHKTKHPSSSQELWGAVFGWVWGLCVLEVRKPTL